jgi:hypothetical protein
MFKADQQATQREGRARIRRVVIEERQRKTLEHVRLSTGYAEDLDPHAHDQSTFRLINQRKELDSLRGAATVVPALDDWKYWTKMNDWDSRNRLLEQLTDKMRRREASQAEIQLLVVLCRPAWQAVMLSLRRYGGLDLDPGAAGVHQREEARRVNELDRAELDQVVQNALMDVLRDCPRPFPRRFFPWVKNVLAHRALDHVHGEITEGRQHLPYDDGIQYVLDELLTGEGRGAGFFAAPASGARHLAEDPGPSQGLRARPRVRDLRADTHRLRARRRASARSPAPGDPAALLREHDPGADRERERDRRLERSQHPPGRAHEPAPRRCAL